MLWSYPDDLKRSCGLTEIEELWPYLNIPEEVWPYPYDT